MAAEDARENREKAAPEAGELTWERLKWPLQAGNSRRKIRLTCFCVAVLLCLRYVVLSGSSWFDPFYPLLEFGPFRALLEGISVQSIDDRMIRFSNGYLSLPRDLRFTLPWAFLGIGLAVLKAGLIFGAIRWLTAKLFEVDIMRELPAPGPEAGILDPVDEAIRIGRRIEPGGNMTDIAGALLYGLFSLLVVHMAHVYFAALVEPPSPRTLEAVARATSGPWETIRYSNGLGVQWHRFPLQGWGYIFYPLGMAVMLSLAGLAFRVLGVSPARLLRPGAVTEGMAADGPSGKRRDPLKRLWRWFLRDDATETKSLVVCLTAGCAFAYVVVSETAWLLRDLVLAGFGQLAASTPEAEFGAIAAALCVYLVLAAVFGLLATGGFLLSDRLLRRLERYLVGEGLRQRHPAFFADPVQNVLERLHALVQRLMNPENIRDFVRLGCRFFAVVLGLLFAGILNAHIVLPFLNYNPLAVLSLEIRLDKYAGGGPFTFTDGFTLQRLPLWQWLVMEITWLCFFCLIYVVVSRAAAALVFRIAREDIERYEREGSEDSDKEQQD